MLGPLHLFTLLTSPILPEKIKFRHIFNPKFWNKNGFESYERFFASGLSALWFRVRGAQGGILAMMP